MQLRYDGAISSSKIQRAGGPGRGRHGRCSGSGLRPWTAPETASFRRELARTDRRVHVELGSEDRRLAVQRDSERAAAWSELVRRIAPAPQAGAGRRLPPAFVRRAPTRLVGDDFKASHPDYYQLLRDDPRSAGAAIRADYKAWFAQAEEYVRLRRGDVLIEATPGSTEEFFASPLPFATTGYPVELVVLAVREADSRLATALRYAWALQRGGTGRFTTRAGHDVCFRPLADVVAVAERHPQIAAVTVIRRDGHALLRHEGAGAGRASWALAAERLRPYTDQEAAAFLRLHQSLRRALPQHRDELVEIAALARPLMPPRVQPARIGRPHSPVWPLPVPRRAGGYESSSSLSRAA